MIYEGKINPCKYEDIHENAEKSFFLTLTRAEFVASKNKFGFPARAVAEAINAKQYPILSIYPDLLFMSVNEVGWHPKKEEWLVAKEVDLFLNNNILVMVAHNATVDILKEKLSLVDIDLGRLLHFLLEKIVDTDRKLITEIEKMITDLEDDIITFSGNMNKDPDIKDDAKKKKLPRKTKVYRNHMEEIIRHRKMIIFLKRYIEPLDEILEELAENEGKFLTDNNLYQFRKLSKKAGRNTKNLNNLREYITQVREAWQAQVDIGLNDVMRVFTVVTAVFLPLTLIAGWYGMNFDFMPELSWEFGYPFAFFLSFIVLVISFWYFKKNKFI